MAWTYEEKFDSGTRSTGDLNGQDSWSGITSFDVQGTVAYQGDQGVIETSGGGGTISRAITAVSSGTVYFAMRRNSTTGDSTTQLRTAGNTVSAIRVSFELSKIRTDNGASTVDILNPYVVDTWYLFELTFDSDNTHTIRYHDGSSWSSSFGPYTALVTTDIDGIGLNSGGTNNQYWDYISPTNPIASATTVPSLSTLGVGN